MKTEASMKHIMVLLAVVFAATAAVPLLCSGQSLSVTTNYPSQIKSRGNQLFNTSNQVVRLKGLMIPEMAVMAEKGHFNPELFNQLQASGANAVRIPVHPQYWKKHTNYLQRFLDPAVQWTGERGLYAIIDWHSIGNPQTGLAPESPDLFCHTKAMTLDFWERVADRYLKLPHIIFELFNEPASISPKDWHDFANQTVKIIRDRGANQLIVVGGVEYGRRLDWVLQEPIAGRNIAYASHIFPSHPPSDWDRDFGQVSQRYPVLITEWGFIAETNRIGTSHRYLAGNSATYGQPLMTYVDGRGIGWIACWFDDQWEPAMFLPDGKGQTGWGKYVELELKQNP